MTMPTVPRFNINEIDYTPMAGGFDGEEAVLYRSPTGNVLAGTFREAGKFTFEFPCDEFFFVVRGSGRAQVHGGETFEFGVNDMLYFREGMIADFEMSKDFQDVACMISNGKPIEYEVSAT